MVDWGKPPSWISTVINLQIINADLKIRLYFEQNAWNTTISEIKRMELEWISTFCLLSRSSMNNNTLILSEVDIIYFYVSNISIQVEIILHFNELGIFIALYMLQNKSSNMETCSRRANYQTAINAFKIAYS